MSPEAVGKASKTRGGKSKKNVTSAQVVFIDKVKTNILQLQNAGTPIPFIFQPPGILYSGSEKKLDVNKWYHRDILVCAPHLNYPKITIPCSCGGSYKPKQWADERIIFGLNERVTLLQYRYECDGCKASKTTGEIVKLEECPDIIRFNTQRQYFMTESKYALKRYQKIIKLIFTNLD